MNRRQVCHLSRVYNHQGHFLLSSGTHAYLAMLIIRSVILLVLKPSDVFIISLTTKVGPTAFPMFIPPIVAEPLFFRNETTVNLRTNPLYHPTHSQQLGASQYSSSPSPSNRLHQTPVIIFPTSPIDNIYFLSSFVQQSWSRSSYLINVKHQH